MKKHLLASALSVLGILHYSTALSQDNLVPDQNPNFAVSMNKYTKMVDSVNQWHSTTVQETYKAYDWYEQKQERRNERLRFRRELRLEQARNFYYYQPYQYNRRYNGYYNRYYRNSWWNSLLWCF